MVCESLEIIFVWLNVRFVVLEEAGGWSKGCGLVEFSSPDEAQNAIDMLNDTELEGRNIFVREDREPDGGSITSIARRGGRGSGRSSGGRGNSRFAGRAPREGNSGYGHSSEIKQVYVGNVSRRLCRGENVLNLYFVAAVGHDLASFGKYVPDRW